MDDVAIISEDAADVTAMKSSINYIYGCQSVITE
jgi:hypothetical protein